MKLIIAAFMLCSFLCVSAAQAAPKDDALDNLDNNGRPKVTICHVPPGNPANAHTITIGPKAAIRHLANHSGDTIGPCPGDCPCGGCSSSSSDGCSSSSEDPCPPNGTGLEP